MSRRSLTSLVFVSSLVVGGAAPALAQDPDAWLLLAEGEVAQGASSLRIPVVGRGGTFHEVRLMARDAPVEVVSYTVTFGNLQQQVVQVGETLAPGASTQALDLAGANRFIARVDVTLAAGAAARVQLQGHARHWHLAGAGPVTPDDAQVTVPVGAGSGTFDALRLAVEDATLDVRGVTVHFSNGTQQQLSIRRRFLPGTMTFNHDLQGGGRQIDRVVIDVSVASCGAQPQLQVFVRDLDDSDDATDEGWVELGRRSFGPNTPAQEIDGLAGRGSFNELKVVVVEGQMSSLSLRVQFGLGRQNVRLGDYAAGADTGPIDLDGANRNLRSVEVRRAGTERATVAVYAR